MRYISVDIETVSLEPDANGIIEFAAVIACSKSGEILDKFERVLKIPYDVIWSPYCKEHNFDWWNKDIQEGKGVKTSDLLKEFRLFLQKNNVDPMNFTVAGKNFAAFDAQFIKKLPGYGKEIKFNYRCLDVGTMFFDPKKDDKIPDTKECSIRAGILENVQHRALSDAVLVVKLLNFTWKIL